MNAVIREVLEELRTEKEMLEQAIVILQGLRRPRSGLYAAVEAVQQNIGRSTSNPRGRKSMPPTEQKEVSERMKWYWANRREQPAD